MAEVPNREADFLFKGDWDELFWFNELMFFSGELGAREMKVVDGKLKIWLRDHWSDLNSDELHEAYEQWLAKRVLE